MCDCSFNSKFCHSDELNLDIRFETYSDAKLASVFLNNMNEFPVALFQQVLDVVLDPRFKSSEVTFKNAWGIFDCVSTYRRGMALNRTLVKPHKAERTSGVIPPVVLGLIVDTFMHWFEMFDINGYDLRNMCLVHRSWTVIAQKGLRRRAIIPYQQINRFLLSPLCGPCVTDMMIYWTLDADDRVGANDLDLLKALFARTTNVHCLVFNTDLTFYRSSEEQDFRVGTCLNVISKSTDYEAWQSLYACLPRMHTLELLSVVGWKASETDLDWNEHPHSLKTVDLGLRYGMGEQLLAWLLRPRGNFRSYYCRCGRVFVNLNICRGYFSMTMRRLSMASCVTVTSLLAWNFSMIEILVHYRGKYLYKAHPSGSQFILSLVKALSILPRLQSLLFITYSGESMAVSRSMFYDGQDSGVYCQLDGATALAGEALPADLIKFCKDRRVHLACVDSRRLMDPNDSDD
ncbi:uncharacterized protein FOMMEDRAFT_154390 [Fomitiporia mediterranea MF3/22]|uniref:uncharacterized protein n=1 Tax=Fomitiporia mediterranea (strain MF3/22) TaxID=694068 RepID=UPI0004408358|nr:uncharacterized protein FOMMEDRAFT_154390 [Fomitiporia mediterranea MF3/22]EJD05177.1 hypothetical protein FOMMEDRAFT_154390 [Fomitiporia mediterranea MF3/22]